ncbi:unnamed protein product [Parascedosporium putredinis]|uniref:Man(5)GlcNAc(2)-PP-dolichol translocation protein RFT1 n=1 Tax=Parascedosporium putredinis TaxID=1442378 RepID=A0A9P1MAY9_9PEZI|nr:unnamed protein product [Parascedosporium putredinis]CAI7995258.1 unnamed protein product [Parascedosporium putredinis]
MSRPAQRGSALRGASFLIVLQVASRLLTFFANQLLLRFLTAPLLGLSARLEAYYLTVLFFARESLRGEQGQAVVNLGYLAVVLGVVVTAALGSFMQMSAGAGAGAERFDDALRLYALAAILELLSEPCFVLMQVRLRFGTRAAAESAGALLRCAATLGSAVWASRAGLDFGVLPFAFGQLAYGATLLVIYLAAGYGVASRDGFSILPRKIAPAAAPKANADNLQHDGAERRKTLPHPGRHLSRLRPLHPHAQGIYALVNNYGGLLARLLFQPIEESSRSYFSRLLAAPEPAQASDKPQADGRPASAPTTHGSSSATASGKASADLHRLLKLYVLGSAAVVTFGPLAARHLLTLVAGPSWSASASPALAAYCYYIPLLAINGVSEAFVASVATEAQVHVQSLFMAGFSVIFGLSAFVALRVLDMDPAVGLVCANAANMVCRIVWCAFFVKSYFRQRAVSFDLFSLAPSGLSVGLCAAAPYLVTKALQLSEHIVRGGAFMSLIAIGAVAVPFVALLYGSFPSLIPCSLFQRPTLATVTGPAKAPKM